MIETAISREPAATEILTPPAAEPGHPQGEWFAVLDSDPVVAHLVAVWALARETGGWEAARLSKAATLYRERATQWAAVVKFFAVKVRSGQDAGQVARWELACIERARSLGLAETPVRAIRPLGVYGGALFLEHVDGLTLEDLIAVRRHRPGSLLPALEQLALFLARLHTAPAEPGAQPAFLPEADAARKYTAQLAAHGVLHDQPVECDRALDLIAGWERDPAMVDFAPVTIHGDATSSNFVVPWTGGLVAIDWERSRVGDPAADLGRLMAELTHSVERYGGSSAEARSLIAYLAGLYLQALPAAWDAAALVRRSRFYQASSTLRIARNGWLPRESRRVLVAQGLALLEPGL